jgi:DNA-binding transcriptional MerR regulator
MLLLNMTRENRTIKILADRAGTVKELTNYLTDLENAYNSLHALDRFLDYNHPESRSSRRMRYFIYEFGLPLNSSLKLDNSSDLIKPVDTLVISRISIQSPGFWEIVGSLNPLQQIREYLKDRHERRKDIEWRETSEKEKAMLENELIQKQIIEYDNKLQVDRIKILKEIGFSNEEIRELIWANAGKPLMELGKHQDNGIIKSAE